MAGTIDIMGITHTVSELSPTEEKLFEAVFNTMIGALTSEERGLYKQRKDVIHAALRIAKALFDNKTFRGFNPSDTDIGVQFIRPEHFNRVSWAVNFQNAGEWIGFVNDGSNRDTPYSLNEDLLAVVIGISSLVPAPKVDEDYVKVGKLEYSPYVLTGIKQHDNENRVSIYPTPTVIVEPKQSFLMELRSYETGSDIVRPIGLIFGLGRTLNKQNIALNTPAVP